MSLRELLLPTDSSNRFQRLTVDNLYVFEYLTSFLEARWQGRPGLLAGATVTDFLQTGYPPPVRVARQA